MRKITEIVELFASDLEKYNQLVENDDQIKAKYQ